jgi:hypothetical protein
VSNFGGSTGAVSAQYKNVDYIDDDALILVSCYGLESGGAWVKTPADCVKYILETDSLFTQIDTTAFDKANAVCDYIVSLPLPARVGDGLPSIRDTISQINSSVFGSLFTTADFLLSYSILNSSKPSSLVTLKDDDILSMSMETKNQIANQVICSYRPQVDFSTGEDVFEVYEFNSGFVDRLSGIKKTDEITLYLYEDDKSQIIAQRYAFFKSLSLSRVRVRSSLNLATKSLNDKIYLELDRLYKRYGGRDRRKIGVISSITKDGFGVEVEFNDLGGIYNRVPSIAPASQAIYASASRDEVAKYGFILDNDTETPDASSEAELGNILIG